MSNYLEKITINILRFPSECHRVRDEELELVQLYHTPVESD